MAQRNKIKRNVVRIIGGIWRRRLLHFPVVDGLRPTADAVRERVFNWLGQDLTGWCCADLFAGSGALGFEAASRGAATVYLVEKDAVAFAALQANQQQLGADLVQLVRADALAWLISLQSATNTPVFDLVLLDPPFGSSVYDTVLEKIKPLLAPLSLVYVEHNGAFCLPDGWQMWRDGRNGLAYYCLLRQTP